MATLICVGVGWSALLTRNEEIRHCGQWPASAVAGRIIYDKPKSVNPELLDSYVALP